VTAASPARQRVEIARAGDAAKPTPEPVPPCPLHQFAELDAHNRAMSRLNWLGRKSIPETSWLARMVARKPWMLLAIALANKMARTIWALLTKNEDYRVPAQAVVA
jgi:hypothetical protein